MVGEETRIDSSLIEERRSQIRKLGQVFHTGEVQDRCQSSSLNAGRRLDLKLEIFERPRRLVFEDRIEAKLEL